jgi:hypothetical protein
VGPCASERNTLTREGEASELERDPPVRDPHPGQRGGSGPVAGNWAKSEVAGPTGEKLFSFFSFFVHFHFSFLIFKFSFGFQIQLSAQS